MGKGGEYQGHKDNYSVSIMYHHQEESTLIIFSLWAPTLKINMPRKSICLALIGLYTPSWGREDDDSFWSSFHLSHLEKEKRSPQKYISMLLTEERDTDTKQSKENINKGFCKHRKDLSKGTQARMRKISLETK